MCVCVWLEGIFAAPQMVRPLKYSPSPQTYSLLLFSHHWLTSGKPATGIFSRRHVLPAFIYSSDITSHNRLESVCYCFVSLWGQTDTWCVWVYVCVCVCVMGHPPCFSLHVANWGFWKFHKPQNICDKVSVWQQHWVHVKAKYVYTINVLYFFFFCIPHLIWYMVG